MASTRACISGSRAGPRAGFGTGCSRTWWRDQKNPYLDARFDHRPSPPASGHGPQKRGSEDKALGRSRGGLSTKIHLLTNGLGEPLRLSSDRRPGSGISRGPAAAGTGVKPRRCSPTRAMTRTRSSPKSRASEQPPSSHPDAVEKCSGSHDRTLYKLRNRIERCFNRLKQFRRLATRYCKRRPCFQATVALACSWLHLIKYVDTA